MWPEESGEVKSAHSAKRDPHFEMREEDARAAILSRIPARFLFTFGKTGFDSGGSTTGALGLDIATGFFFLEAARQTRRGNQEKTIRSSGQAYQGRSFPLPIRVFRNFLAIEMRGMRAECKHGAELIGHLGD